MTDDTISVLLIDDDRADYVITRDLLEEVRNASFDLEWVSTYDEGLEAALAGRHDVVLLDYRLGTRDGVELLRAATARGCRMPVIMLTAVDELSVDVEAMAAGAADYLAKGKINAPLLERAIRYALEGHRMRRRLEESRDDMLSILDQLRTGTAMANESGRITFVSQACERIIGRPRADVLGLPWEQLCPMDPNDLANLKTMLERPPEVRAKVPARVETPTGQVYWIEVEVHDDPRDARRKIFVVYDVSELHGLRRMLDGKTRFGDLVGKSEPMRVVYQQIQDLSRFDTTVLIEGETGTGKELVARAIHYASHRKDKPFVPVNCAGLTDSLLASQLFGHRRGAFTGAIEDHRGFFEAANGGTVFLDELADLPANVQTSLLRVLQEREITRLGESTPRKIDVRVLAATNRDLNREVQEDRFRPDLLYRVRVARIVLPALRQRREDIPLLAEWFLRQVRARTGKDVRDIAPKTMGVLMRHNWPGNVRELENAVEAGAVRCRGSALEVEDLPPEIGYPAGGAAEQTYAERERARLADALAYTGGNRAKAARLLGISRTTLYRRLASMDDDADH